MKPALKSILTESFVPFLVIMLSAVLFLYYIDNLIEEISIRPKIIDLDTQKDDSLEISPVRHQLPVEGLAENDTKRIIAINTLVFKKDFAGAIEKIKDLPHQAGTAEEVRLLLSYCYMKSGNSGKGIAVLDELAVEKHSAKLYFYYGLIYAEDPRTYDRAIENYNRFLSADSRSYEAMLNLAIIHYRKRDFDTASGLFTRASEVSSGRRRSLAVYRAGLCHNEKGDTSAAEESFNSAIKLDPMNLRARKKLASLIYKKSPSAGIEEYNRIIMLNTSYTYGYYFVGKHYLDAGDVIAATEILKRGINAVPDSASLKSLLGSIYLDQMDFDNARDLYSELVTEKPGDKVHHFNLARAYSGLKNNTKAVEKYLDALKLDPGYYKAIQNLGVAYARIGNDREALKYYIRASKIEPDSHLIFYNMGVLYQKLGKNSEAIKNFNRAISLQNNYPAAYSNLGLIYSRMNDKERAVKCYETSISQDKQYQLPYVNLSLLYRKIQKPDLEEKILREGDAATGDLKIKTMLASLLFEKKELDSALEIYLAIYGIDRSNTDALMGIALIYLEKKNYDQSSEYIKKYIFYQPTSYSARYIYMVSLFNLKDYQGAGNEIEIINNLQPGYNDIASYSRWIREKTGR